MNFEQVNLLRRRTFLGQSAAGMGIAALSSMMHQPASANPLSASLGVVNPLHFAPKAKRVIFLTMAGGPSHFETFDEKLELARLNGQPMPESLTKGQPIAQLQGSQLSCMGPQHPFQKHGESGQNIATILPHISTLADDICIVRSMMTEQINHDPAHTFLNTGTQISGRPSMGSWLLYGLGSECEDLPGFVVMTSAGGGQNQPIAARQWHSGFLPSKFQGVEFQSKGDPVLYVSSPKGVDREGQKNVVQAINQLNQHRSTIIDDPEIATRIAQYEMAFRMQTSVPDLTNFADEPKHILDMYGTQGSDGTFASNCLLARKMAERGVRFIQLYHRGWDHHGGVKEGTRTTAGLVDQGTAALIKDLKQRDLLKDTLIVWGGEFGRTPMAQGTGRDHHIRGFSLFMCGAGIKPGFSYGNTDDFGYNAVENPVHIHDLHATMLHLLGIDHEKLTYRYQGRDFRLTDVAGHVVHDILT